MTERRQELLEHTLAQDVRRYRDQLIERHPEYGRTLVQKYVAAYTRRRRAELIGDDGVKA
jgi:hypothetical protein